MIVSVKIINQYYLNSVWWFLIGYNILQAPFRSSNPLPTRIVSIVTNARYKDFDDIPGPTALPLIGTRHLYLPFVGTYSYQDLCYNGFAKLRKYGSIVREDIKPGVTLVWIFTPEDYATLYKNEGTQPCRRSHLAMEKYRLDRPQVYNNGGLLPSWVCVQISSIDETS